MRTIPDHYDVCDPSHVSPANSASSSKYGGWKSDSPLAHSVFYPPCIRFRNSSTPSASASCMTCYCMTHYVIESTQFVWTNAVLSTLNSSLFIVITLCAVLTPGKKRPTGGNGGRGGDVYVVADRGLNGLSFNTFHFNAGNGKNGGSKIWRLVIHLFSESDNRMDLLPTVPSPIA